MPTLYDRIKAGEFLFLDGGTETELAMRGIPRSNDPCWSARAVLTHPEIIRAIHADFIRAGSDILTALTLNASPMLLEAVGLGDDWEKINRQAVTLAYDAIEDVAPKRQIHVIGSISTLFPEIHAAHLPSHEERAMHAQQAKLLAQTGTEAIFVEIAHDIEHARCALEGAHEAGIATWGGFSCTMGEKGLAMLTGSTASFEQALLSLLPVGLKVACLTNIIASNVPPCLEILRRHWAGAVGVTPHASRSALPSRSITDAYTPEEYRAKVRQWISAGVRIVGGCCDIGPEYIHTAREGITVLG